MLVPKHLAGWSVGKKTMQDDDDIKGGPPRSPRVIDTEAGLDLITEAGDTMLTET